MNVKVVLRSYELIVTLAKQALPVLQLLLSTVWTVVRYVTQLIEHMQTDGLFRI